MQGIIDGILKKSGQEIWLNTPVLKSDPENTHKDGASTVSK